MVKEGSVPRLRVSGICGLRSYKKPGRCWPCRPGDVSPHTGSGLTATGGAGLTRSGDDSPVSRRVGCPHQRDICLVVHVSWNRRRLRNHTGTIQRPIPHTCGFLFIGTIKISRREGMSCSLWAMYLRGTQIAGRYSTWLNLIGACLRRPHISTYISSVTISAISLFLFAGDWWCFRFEEEEMAMSIGTMDGAYFVGRNEILSWINATLQLNLSKVEEVVISTSCIELIHSALVAMISLGFC